MTNPTPTQTPWWGPSTYSQNKNVPSPNQYVFPKKAGSLNFGERGIASLTHMGKTLRFRTNPNEFEWGYNINKRIDQTYGGRVVQLLGVKIEDFTVKADCGLGRWDYMAKVAKFVRDIMVAQRNGIPATFEYTTRGWKLNCYIDNIPFEDAVEAVARQFEIRLKVQEDVSGVISKNMLDAELNRLKEGIGWHRSRYNDPFLQGQSVNDQEAGMISSGIAQAQGFLARAANESGGILGYAANEFGPVPQSTGVSPPGVPPPPPPRQEQ